MRDFFRPEFFNRIDSVVSFDPLPPEAVCRIEEQVVIPLARYLVQNPALRDGVIYLEKDGEELVLG